MWYVMKEWANEEAESNMEVINAVVKATRTLRMAYELQPRLRYIKNALVLDSFSRLH